MKTASRTNRKQVQNPDYSRTVRIPVECWEAVAIDAVRKRSSVYMLLGDLIRRAYKLPDSESSTEAA